MIAGFLWILEPSGIPKENHKTNSYLSECCANVARGKTVLKSDEAKRWLIHDVILLSETRCGAVRIRLVVLVSRFSAILLL